MKNIFSLVLLSIASLGSLPAKSGFFDDVGGVFKKVGEGIFNFEKHNVETVINTVKNLPGSIGKMEDKVAADPGQAALAAGMAYATKDPSAVASFLQGSPSSQEGTAPQGDMQQPGGMTPVQSFDSQRSQEGEGAQGNTQKPEMMHVPPHASPNTQPFDPGRDPRFPVEAQVPFDPQFGPQFDPNFSENGDYVQELPLQNEAPLIPVSAPYAQHYGRGRPVYRRVFMEQDPYMMSPQVVYVPQTTLDAPPNLSDPFETGTQLNSISPLTVDPLAHSLAQTSALKNDISSSVQTSAQTLAQTPGSSSVLPSKSDVFSSFPKIEQDQKPNLTLPTLQDAPKKQDDVQTNVLHKIDPIHPLHASPSSAEKISQESVFSDPSPTSHTQTQNVPPLNQEVLKQETQSSTTSGPSQADLGHDPSSIPMSRAQKPMKGRARQTARKRPSKPRPRRRLLAPQIPSIIEHHVNSSENYVMKGENTLSLMPKTSIFTETDPPFGPQENGGQGNFQQNNGPQNNRSPLFAPVVHHPFTTQLGKGLVSTALS